MDNKQLIRFGEFIAKKRIDQGITLRGMADMLEITPAYLSDIEKSRRNPPDKPLLEKIATILKLTEDDKNLMFDLAGKGRCEVSPDLPEYIMSNEVVRVALRKAKDVATEDDWQQFIDKLSKKGYSVD
ncbi:XRE family transcriptional regulator [Desulforamulus profundi]|uniref:XRE family transcriptional regulator n=1 Tax=Desulforamulus profundi TaxID=1383067 RepID=A0A2C6MDK0_9FIRM|nr:helix-turn-helix transcriptional regulator [Desulforamulus profundi]PHJ37675.1 XRE family transcriptional regulator [Desulforamulus profundi]